MSRAIKARQGHENLPPVLIDFTILPIHNLRVKFNLFVSFFMILKPLKRLINKVLCYGTHDWKSWATFVERNKSDGFTGYIQLRGT